MATRSEQRRKYRVAQDIVDVCSRVQEDLNSHSGNFVQEYLKDERHLRGKLLEKFDLRGLDTTLDYRPSSLRDRRSHIDALVVGPKGKGKILVEIKKQRMHDQKYDPRSVQDQLLRLVVQAQLEGGLAMFIWIGDSGRIGDLKYFLHKKKVPACRDIRMDTEDEQTILEKVRKGLRMKSNQDLDREYKEQKVADMNFTEIRIYRINICGRIQHQRLYIRVWIIDPTYRDVNYKPLCIWWWIRTSQAEAEDIDFCTNPCHDCQGCFVVCRD